MKFLDAEQSFVAGERIVDGEVGVFEAKIPASIAHIVPQLLETAQREGEPTDSDEIVGALIFGLRGLTSEAMVELIHEYRQATAMDLVLAQLPPLEPGGLELRGEA